MRNDPPELVAARQYRVVTSYPEQIAAQFGNRFIRFQYEELCRHPIETVRYIAERCDLRWTREFEATIPRELHSTNLKWKERFDESALERMRSEDPPFFRAHEFD